MIKRERKERKKGKKKRKKGGKNPRTGRPKTGTKKREKELSQTCV
jgi:hypothetical protein